MRGHRYGVTLTAAAGLLVLPACGGADAEPDPEPTATSAATSAGPAPQPEGADGVTWEIQNWDDHADDPAVLTWKKYNEAFAASINEGSLLPAARDLSSREVLEDYLGSFDYALANDLRPQELTHVKVADVETTDDGAVLVVCVWTKTAELVTADGDYASDEEAAWRRQEADLVQDEGTWTLTRAEYDGTCDGEDPT